MFATLVAFSFLILNNTNLLGRKARMLAKQYFVLRLLHIKRCVFYYAFNRIGNLESELKIGTSIVKFYGGFMVYLGNFSLTRNRQIWLSACMMYIMTLILVRSREIFFFFLREGDSISLAW